MYELNQLNSRTYYFDCPSRIGLYKQNETDVYLIDSGNGKFAAKKALKEIESRNWNLKGILCTHAHADHIGGNSYLQETTGCKIFAHKNARCLVENPELNIVLLYGADPIEELYCRFLSANPSECLDVNDPEFPKEIKVVELEGHASGMVGYLCDDGTFFTGDAFSSYSTIEKYGITYNFNISKTVESLLKLKTVDAGVFLASHSEPLNDINDIVGYNIKEIERIAEIILSYVKEKNIFEDILSRVFKEFNVEVNTVQYALIGSTVKSYLTYLKDLGKITAFTEDGKLFWKSV